jgi:hypothetical protein
VTAEFKPELPEGMGLPDGHSINTSHADYKALEALAREEGWTQKLFSRVLGLEAKRTMTKAAAAPAPAPAPAASGVPANRDKMSAREQMAYSLANSPGRRPLQ